jgi:hypothetical protein
MDEMTNGGTLKTRRWFLEAVYFIVKYVAPIVIIAIAIASIIK